MSELLPACSNKPHLSQKLFESDGKNLVLEIREAETIVLGDLSNYISVRSWVYLLPVAFFSKYIFFVNSNINF